MADNRVVSVLGSSDSIVTLEEAKLYVRVKNDRDDTIITSMIAQGIELAEAFLSRDILSRQREYFIPFVNKEIYLPFTPLLTTVPIQVEVDGVALVLDEGFSTFGYENPSIRIGTTSFRYNRPNESNAVSYDVKISYTTKGYGSELKQGILAAVAYLYKASGRAELGQMSNVMTDYKTILAPNKRLYI